MERVWWRWAQGWGGRSGEGGRGERGEKRERKTSIYEEFAAYKQGCVASRSSLGQDKTDVNGNGTVGEVVWRR
jgi:hypothetical protein